MSLARTLKRVLVLCLIVQLQADRKITTILQVFCSLLIKIAPLLFGKNAFTYQSSRHDVSVDRGYSAHVRLRGPFVYFKATSGFYTAVVSTSFIRIGK